MSAFVSALRPLLAGLGNATWRNTADSIRVAFGSRALPRFLLGKQGSACTRVGKASRRPARNPLASERFSNNRPPSGRAIRYINKSLLPRTEAPNGTSSGSEPPDRQVRRHRRNKCGSQAEPRSKNRRTAQERSVRRGSLRQPATDNRNPIVADRYPIGPAPPFHASSSKFSLSMADRSPRTPRGQTKKPTRFASARRTAYRNRTSICRLRIYRPNR